MERLARPRWIAATLGVLVLVSSCSVSVLASASEPDGSVDIATDHGAPPPEWMGPDDMPGASAESREQLLDGFFDQQSELERQSAWLASPGAQAQREDSLTAYRDMSDAEALALLGQQWGAQLVSPLPDAETLVGADRISGFVDDSTMRVEGLDGRKDRLVVADVPLRTVDDSGELTRTDVDLARSGDSFVPENSPAETEIPVELGDGAEIDDVVITPEGEATGVKLDADTVAYPNVDLDTDVAFVSALTGIETFHQLRSDRAPEELRLSLGIPAGAVVVDTPNGGAAIVRDGDLVASVSAPTAVDAQGEPVSTSLRIDGSDVLIDVPHRGKDLAYPILVDPFVEEDWARNGTTNTTGTWFHQNPTAIAGLGNWSSYNSPNVGANVYAPRFACYTPVAYTCYSPTHNGSASDGLHMMVRSNTSYPAGSFAEWFYVPPGFSTRINRVDWGAMHLRPGGVAASPSFFYGILSSVTQQWLALRTFSNATAGGAVNNITHDWYAQFAGTQPGPQYLVAGWQQTAGTSVNVPYWRDGYIGGMIVQLTDPDQPTNLTVAKTGPTGWTSNGAFTAAPEARDAGVGMKSFTLKVPSTSGSQAQTRTHPCTGRKSSPCPSYDYRTPPAASSKSWKLPDATIAGVNGTAFAFTAADANPAVAGNQPMPEGINTITLEARDIIHGDTTSTNTTWQAKIDRTAPTGTLTGVDDDQLLLSEDYPLVASAQDSLSGVSTVSLKLNGQTQATNSSCPSGSQPCSVSWTLDGANQSLTDGTQTISVVSTDLAGNVSTTTTEALVDRTAPTLNFAGGLDASGDWLGGGTQGLRMVATDDGESDSPATGAATVELIVDGTSVFSESDGACVDDECSIDVTGTTNADTLSVGTHSIAIAARDQAGNLTTESWVVKVDNHMPASSISGNLSDANFVSATETLHVAAVDGDLIQPESEVVAITLSIDGHEVSRADRDTSECLLGPCSLGHDFSVNAGTLTAGAHELAVAVVDAVGNVNTASWTVNVPTSLAGTVCPGIPAAQTGASVPTADLVSPAQAQAAIEQEAPAVVAPSDPMTIPGGAIDPTLKVRPESVLSDGSPAPAEVSAELQHGMAVGDPADPLCIAPIGIAPNASAPVVIGGDSALVANSQAGVDTVVRPTAVGVETLVQIRDASAPQDFSWKVSLPEGQSLLQVAPDLIAVIDSGGAPPAELDEPIDQSPPASEDDTDIDDNFGPAHQTPAASAEPTLGVTAAEQRDELPDAEKQLKGATLALERAESATDAQVIGLITAPWAADAADASVPVSLTTIGDQVTMTVDHDNATFPVIADPAYVSAPSASAALFSADMNDCGSTSPCGNYNAGKAATYARKYGPKYNPFYVAYSNDCTNFASQVLHAGGMNFMREYKTGQGSWWSASGGWHGDTDSWRLAQVFRNHLLEYALAIHTHKWYVGDVIYWNWHDGGSAVDHISMVSDISGGTVYVANHSSRNTDANYGHKPLAEVKKRAYKKHKKYTFERLHIRHTKANI